MKIGSWALALIPSLLVIACGGGGGSSGAIMVPPQAVVITEANAKPVAANALDSAQSSSATQAGAGLLTGVQIEESSGAGFSIQNNFVWMVEAARGALASVAPTASVIATGIAINATQSCALGGSVTVNGSVASAAGLSAGDNVTLDASNCKLNQQGVASTMNGRMSLTVNSGSLFTFPYHVVISVMTTSLSVQSGAVTVVSSGDVRLDWTAASATVQTLVATGSSLNSRTMNGTTSRSSTWTNYTQSWSISGSTVSSSLAASVVTDSSRLGTNGASYTITTPSAVVWNSGTGVVSAGVVKVVGAGNSQLLATVGAGNTVTIQIDANGDGTFEKTITSTVDELKSLL